MQVFKVPASARRSITALRRPTLMARLSSSPEDQLRNEVLVEGTASARTAVLNRPSALNALNNNMGIRLKKLYESWEENPDVGFVMMKGSGRAFSAGGDVVALYQLIKEGGYLAWGYHGGGAGVSVPGKFRIATDKTIFATPEVHIGFHPDAGASFYLSHLIGHLGEYLALTGERLNGVDMLAVGLATHYSKSAKLGWIDERLAKLVTDDPSAIDSTLEQYGDIIYPDKNSIIHRLDIIDKCFGHETVEEILDSLEIEAARTNNDWCVSALKKLKEASPLSLKISLRSVRQGRFQTLAECLVREYRISLHGVSGSVSQDFCEGVRARLVDKDLAPKWDPPLLENVSDDMVDYYFSSLGEFEPDLKPPTHFREAFI